MKFASSFESLIILVFQNLCKHTDTHIQEIWLPYTHTLYGKGNESLYMQPSWPIHVSFNQTNLIKWHNSIFETKTQFDMTWHDKSNQN